MDPIFGVYVGIPIIRFSHIVFRFEFYFLTNDLGCFDQE